MNNEQRAAYATRVDILAMLSDDEIALVSTAESGRHLHKGDEYVDLDKPQEGVHKVNGMGPPIGHVLPRKAVREETWSRILASLPAVS